MIPEGHCWSSNSNLNWAYRMEPDAEALKEDYLVLLRQVWSLHHLHGLSAAVYTQTTDVETECNGLLSYDRAVAKLSPEVLAQANLVGRDQTAGRVIVAGRDLRKCLLELHVPTAWPGLVQTRLQCRRLEGRSGRLRHAWDTPERWSTRFGRPTTSGCGGSLRLGPRTCAA
jgi:hypothetical protein